MFILQIIICLLIADFLSGVSHWVVDAYSPKDNAFIKRHITDPVILHHYKPREFTKNSWIKSTWAPMLVASIFGLGINLIFGFNWMTVLTLLLQSMGKKYINGLTELKRKMGRSLHFCKI